MVRNYRRFIFKFRLQLRLFICVLEKKNCIFFLVKNVDAFLLLKTGRRGEEVKKRKKVFVEFFLPNSPLAPTKGAGGV